MTMFDILNDVIRDKTGKLAGESTFEKDFNVFMVARYMSMRHDLAGYGDFINKYGKVLSKENIYYYLLDNIPKSKNCFIKYISKKKKEV
jgi:hypothetical protein